MFQKDPKDIALSAFFEVSETMLGVVFETSDSEAVFDPKKMAYGGSVSLLRGESSWEIALFGNLPLP